MERKMSNGAPVHQQTREYYVGVLMEGSLYFRVFSARDAIERINSLMQNVKSIVCADTGSNLYLLALEAVERALSLKKVLDEYNNSLLVPVCFSWIVVGPCGCDEKVWSAAHKKPQGNCGILIHPDVEWSRELEGFTSFRLESGVLCLEQRFFSVEKLEGETTVITEPIVLTLVFESAEAKDSFRIPDTVASFSKSETELELYVERLDCSLIERAVNEGVVKYTVWREQEIALFQRKTPPRMLCRFEDKVHQPNVIPECCLPYCDLLEQLPLAASLTVKEKESK